MSKKIKTILMIGVIGITAFIGILTGVFLGHKQSIPETADSRIILNLAELRFKAADIYSEGGNYDNLTIDYPIVKPTADTISSLYGRLIIKKPASPADQYCAYSRLPVHKDWYCIDSAGKVLRTTTSPSSTCNKGSYKCEID